MALNIILRPQWHRLEYLEYQVQDGGRRLDAIEPLHQRMTAVSARMQAMFPDVLQLYPPPPSVLPKTFWQRLVEWCLSLSGVRRHTPSAHKADWMLLPSAQHVPVLRQSWEKRYDTMLQDEIPRLIKESQAARHVAEQYATKLPTLAPRLDAARRLEVQETIVPHREGSLPGDGMTQPTAPAIDASPPQPLSFGRRVLHRMRRPWSTQRDDVAKAVVQPSIVTRVVTLSQLLDESLLQIVPARSQLEQGLSDLERGWANASSALDRISAMIGPGEAQP